MNDLTVLHTTAAVVGIAHTLIGPDHYIPFVAMARTSRWSLSRSLAVTAICGLGHVLGSIVLGGAGIVLGLAVERLEVVEGVRSSIAGWLLLGFGLIYFCGGIVRGVRNTSHQHWHSHSDGTLHQHQHTHDSGHLHLHAAIDQVSGEASPQIGRWAPWALFVVFFFGPCEPLIPLLMYPAANSHWLAVLGVTLAFTLTTLATMLVMVGCLYAGASCPWFQRMDRFGHAFAGLAITSCGLAIKLGL